MKKHPEIYKYDSKGKVRVWSIEQDGEKYRTVAGIDGGSLVTSEWTFAQATNVGRANERDPVAQADFEVAAAYENKLTREYHRTVEEAGCGAHFFKPMLAKEYDPAKFTTGFAQPKLDGIRCIATKDGLFSRQGKPITSCPHIIDALAPVFEKAPNAVLDGELYNHDLKDDFNTIISLVRKAAPNEEQLKEIAAKVQYHVYDVPSIDSPFIDRSIVVAVVGRLVQNNPAIQPVQTHAVQSAEEFDLLYANWLHSGYEGGMWRANAKYEQKRSKALLKRKDFQDDEFEVVAIEEGEGNWAGAAKRVICKLPDGRTFGAGIRGTYQRGVELLTEDHKVVTVRFFAYTPDGVPRFGVVTKFHGAKRTL